MLPRLAVPGGVATKAVGLLLLLACLAWGLAVVVASDSSAQAQTDSCGSAASIAAAIANDAAVEVVGANSRTDCALDSASDKDYF